MIFTIIGSLVMTLGFVQVVRVAVRAQKDLDKEIVRRLLLQKSLRRACSYLDSAAQVIRDEGLCEEDEDEDVTLRLREWRVQAGVE